MLRGYGADSGARIPLTHIRKPVVGDLLSGGPMRGAGLPSVLRDAPKALPRQALHARELEVTHPTSGKRAADPQLKCRKCWAFGPGKP